MASAFTPPSIDSTSVQRPFPAVFPEFLPPAGLIPSYAYGVGQKGFGTEIGDLGRFIDSPATRLGPSALKNASLWLNSDGKFDFMLYNFLWVCSLNRVSEKHAGILSQLIS